jgi:hypothetical protein
MTGLGRRILVEKRWLVAPLALAAIANVVVYLLAVRPLAASTAGAADRAGRAAASLMAAEREVAAARALVTGADTSAARLRAFYEEILPIDRASARRMTYAPLPDLAARNKVRYNRRSQDIVDVDEDRRLARLQMRMELEGPYERVRAFIFDLESSQEFVIIDDVALTQRSEGDDVSLSIGVSTYFRAPEGPQ